MFGGSAYLFAIIKGTVYFTAKMLAATDRLELYCAASRTLGLVAWCNTKKRSLCQEHAVLLVV